MTSERVPTPASIRRQDTINDAITSAEHLLSVLRGYRAARRDGFPLSHLARIEAVLQRTRTQVEQMLVEEKRTLRLVGLASDEVERLSLSATRVSAAKPATVPAVAPVLTLPPDDDLDIPQSTAGDCN